MTMCPWNKSLKVKILCWIFCTCDGTIITDQWKHMCINMLDIWYIKCIIELMKNNLWWKICVSVGCSARPLKVAKWWPQSADLNAPFEQRGCTGASWQHFRCQYASVQFTAWFQRCGGPAFQIISQTFCTRGTTCSNRLHRFGICHYSLNWSNRKCISRKNVSFWREFQCMQCKLLVWFCFSWINTDWKSIWLPGTVCIVC